MSKRARTGLDASECLQDRADDLGGRGDRQVEADRGRLREHRVVLAGVACHGAEIGPNEHDRLLRAERVADLLAGARVRGGAVHDRDQAVGPVDPRLVGCSEGSRRWVYLYRAADQFGQVIDVYASTRRDSEAARRFFRRARKATGVVPVEVITDRAPTYPRSSIRCGRPSGTTSSGTRTTGSSPTTRS